MCILHAHARSTLPSVVIYTVASCMHGSSSWVIKVSMIVKGIASAVASVSQCFITLAPGGNGMQ